MKKLILFLAILLFAESHKVNAQKNFQKKIIVLLNGEILVRLEAEEVQP